MPHGYDVVLAGAHGGDLTLARSTPQGSLFLLTLPLEGPGELVYPAVRYLSPA